MVGKRDTVAKSIQSSVVSIECCDTDMCNIPTSTTVPTTMTTPMTTIHFVHGKTTTTQNITITNLCNILQFLTAIKK